MPYTIENKIRRLQALENPALRAYWEQLGGPKMNPRLNRDFLIRLIAKHLQEKAYGGLDNSTQKRLQRLATESFSISGKSRPSISPIKPGTRLIRQWRGDSHEVIVGDKGFTYRGQPYRTLSIIARKITGTQWSGPRFFGISQADLAKMDNVHGR